ncbi:hypothetical protein [Thauera sp. 63]|uniref:hypothetical protein n=1 Tax=Thauera sp. 63 TaxID=497321 RepID=UPI0002D0F3EC|nr:hypothetical protein [Thauera sp. 63]ENO80333.1 hypothetical protein C664_01285 [Thauera sp. 63]
MSTRKPTAKPTPAAEAGQPESPAPADAPQPPPVTETVTEPAADAAPAAAVTLTPAVESDQPLVLAADAAAAAVQPEQAQLVRVTATKRTGRYRAGRFWPPEPTTVDRAEFDGAAWAQLEADPRLRIEPATDTTDGDE